MMRRSPPFRSSASWPARFPLSSWRPPGRPRKESSEGAARKSSSRRASAPAWAFPHFFCGETVFVAELFELLGLEDDIHRAPPCQERLTSQVHRSVEYPILQPQARQPPSRRSRRSRWDVADVYSWSESAAGATANPPDPEHPRKVPRVEPIEAAIVRRVDEGSRRAAQRRGRPRALRWRLCQGGRSRLGAHKRPHHLGREALARDLRRAARAPRLARFPAAVRGPVRPARRGPEAGPCPGAGRPRSRGERAGSATPPRDRGVRHRRPVRGARRVEREPTGNQFGSLD